MQTKVTSYFQGGQTAVNYFPATEANALTIADTLLNTRSTASTITTHAEQTTPVTQAIRVKVSARNNTTFQSLRFSFWMKPTKTEEDIKTALVNTTWEGVKIDEITNCQMALYDFS